MTGEYTPHGHYCELDLFHKKNKRVWQENCPCGKRPKSPAFDDRCDSCKHCIIITFEDTDCLMANGIIRNDTEGVEAE